MITIFSKIKDALYNNLYPFERRVRITSSCLDAEYIPKVENAGKIYDGMQIMHNGLKIPVGCYAGPWMSDLIMRLKGHHEPQEEKAFHEILQVLEPGATMIELGSYWAYYSLWFMKEIENPNVYLIEPKTNNMTVGLNNFKINGFSEPTHIQRKVFDRTDEEHGLITVDDFVDMHCIQRVDILHSDIQGFEASMLRGATKTIEAGKIRYMMISTHRGKHGTCLRMMQNYGFQILVNLPLRLSYHYEGGLIVARYESYTGISSIAISRNPKRFTF